MGGKEKGFVHLGVMTGWTAGGLDMARKYAQTAAAGGMKAAGVGDWQSIAIYPEWEKECQDAGVQAIFGARFKFKKPNQNETGAVELIVEKPEGFGQVAKLVEAAREADKGALEVGQLEDHQLGLLAIARARSYEQTEEIFGRAQTRLGVVNYGQESIEEIREAKEVAAKHGAKMVAVNEAWRAEPDPWDRILNGLRVAGATGTKVARRWLGLEEMWADRKRFHPEAWMKSAQEMQVLFEEIEGAVHETEEIAARNEARELPKPTLPQYTEADRQLQEEVERLAGKKWQGEVPKDVAERIAEELEMISRTGKATSFLMAGKLTQAAKRRGVAMVPVGSMTVSEVGHELNETVVDPVAEGLPFARFLNPATTTNPDFDWQVQVNRKSEMVEMAVRIAEEEGWKAAGIVTQPKVGVAGAVRMAMRAVGVKEKEISRVEKKLLGAEPMIEPQYWGIIGAALEMAKRELPSGGQPLHPTKIIVYEGELPGVVTRNEGGFTVAEMDKKAAEKYTNYDLVPSIWLEVIDRVCRRVRVEREKLEKGQGMEGVVENVFTHPDAVPYLETDWVKRVLRNYKKSSPGPLDWNSPVEALALSRRGVWKSLGEFLYRMRTSMGKEPGDGSGTDNGLDETYGLVLYQEQVIEMAIAAGFDTVEAEVARRAMTKERQGDKGNMTRDKYIEKAVNKGIEPGEAERRAQMMGASEYRFLRGHAEQLVRCVCLPAAWLKENYPEEFFDEVERAGFMMWPGRREMYRKERERLVTSANSSR